MNTWFNKTDEDEAGLQDQGMLGAEVAGEADPDEDELRDEANAAVEEAAQVVVQEEATQEEPVAPRSTPRPKRGERTPFPWERR